MTSPKILETYYKAILNQVKEGQPDTKIGRDLRQKRKNIARKFNEESVELMIEALKGNKKKITSEAADMLYTFLIMMADRNVPLGDIWAELGDRLAGQDYVKKKK